MSKIWKSSNKDIKTIRVYIKNIPPQAFKTKQELWGKKIKHFKYANLEEKGGDLKSRINTRKYT